MVHPCKGCRHHSIISYQEYAGASYQKEYLCDIDRNLDGCYEPRGPEELAEEAAERAANRQCWPDSDY